MNWDLGQKNEQVVITNILLVSDSYQPRIVINQWTW